MALASAEKREFPRIQIHTPVHYKIRGSSEFNNVVSDNISVGGLGFVNNNFISPGTFLMLELNLLNRVISPLGKTVWSCPIAHSDRYGLGVQFHELDIKEKDYLQDFVNMQLGRI